MGFSLLNRRKATAPTWAPPEVFPAEIVSELRRMLTHLAYRGELPGRLALVAALREEGVTYTSLALASTLASDMNRRVCMVELNWYAPSVQSRVTRAISTAPEEYRHGLPIERQMRSPGLAAVVSGQVDLDDALLPTALPNLTLLPAGLAPAIKRSAIARSDELRSCIVELSRRFDHLVLDIPAILTTSDAVALASFAEATCLVVRQGATPVAQVRQAVEEVKHIPMIGAVMNRVRIRTPRWVRTMIPQE